MLIRILRYFVFSIIILFSALIFTLILGALTQDHRDIVATIGVLCAVIACFLFLCYIPFLIARREFASKFLELVRHSPPPSFVSQIISGLKRRYHNIANEYKSRSYATRIAMALYIGITLWALFQILTSGNQPPAFPRHHNTLDLISVYWLILIFVGVPLWVNITTRRSLRKQLARLHQLNPSIPLSSSAAIAQFRPQSIIAKRLRHFAYVCIIISILIAALRFALQHFPR